MSMKFGNDSVPKIECVMPQVYGLEATVSATVPAESAATLATFSRTLLAESAISPDISNSLAASAIDWSLLNAGVDELVLQNLTTLWDAKRFLKINAGERWR
eukprot:1099001_1